MAYSMALDAVYNQYLTTYAPKKSDTRFDTHKRSELKSITNSMAKVNKDAPLYKIENNSVSREYIVGLKEESRLLQNTITAVMGNADSVSLDGKIAYSTNDNVVSAKYIGEELHEALTDSNMEDEADGAVVAKNAEIPSYDIEVHSLATTQVNLGRFLNKNDRTIVPGDYTFDLSVNGQGYEFQYSIRENDTNLDIQNRLSRLINNAGIHLNSSVEEDENGRTALRIESEYAGVPGGEGTRVFNIVDVGTGRTGSVTYFGIDSVVREATNAHLTINGTELESPSNSFVLEKDYEITLNGVSPEGVTTSIGVKPDTEAAIENINNLIGGINQFIKSVSEYRESQSRASGLLGEIGSIAGYYYAGMSNMGIEQGENGEFIVDKERLNEAILSDSDDSGQKALKGFADAMMRKSRQVSLNPINYLDKTVVEYKNPGKNFLSPYVASAYAGLMFNSYC